MQHKKCGECGFITWASDDYCKRCGTAFIDSLHPSAATVSPETLAEANSSSPVDWSKEQRIHNPGLSSSPAGKSRGWVQVSFSAATAGLLCSALNGFIGALAHPLAVICFLTGLVVSIIVLAKIKNKSWANVGRGRPAAGLAVNGVLLLVYAVVISALALPVLVGRKWKKYVSTEGHYSIQLPGDAHEDFKAFDTTSGPIPFYFSTVSLKDEGVCITGYLDYSDVPINASTDHVLNTFSRTATRIYGATPISEKRISLNGQPGIELLMEPPADKYGPGKLSIARIYWVHPNIYVNIIAGSKTGKLYRDRYKFLDSFQILSPEQIPDAFSRHNGGTSLVDAATSGDVDQLNSLIAQGVLAREKDIALLRAARGGKIGCVRELISVGANVNAKERSGKTALMLAAAYGSNFDSREDSCVAALIKAGADLNAQDPQFGRTALIWSIAGGQLNAASFLIQAGADLEVRDQHGRTALMHAVNGWNKDIVTFLIGRSADLNARDDQGLTVLARAMQQSWSPRQSEAEAVVKLLRDAGASE